jgi:hypothetical protein
MAITGQDSFTDIDGTLLPLHTPEVGSWTAIGITVMQVNGANQCEVVTGHPGGALQQASTGSADHYAQAILFTAVLGGYNIGGPAVRMSSNGDCIYANERLTQSRIFTAVNETLTSIGSSATGIATGDTVRLEVSGTSLTMKVNGATTATATSSVNATEQAPGLFARANTLDPAFDTWESGDLGGAPAAAFIAMVGYGGGSVGPARGLVN